MSLCHLIEGGVLIMQCDMGRPEAQIVCPSLSPNEDAGTDIRS